VYKGFFSCMGVLAFLAWAARLVFSVPWCIVEVLEDE
jgi:hypothetical protein